MNDPLLIAYAVMLADAVLYTLKVPKPEVPRLLLRLALYAFLTVILFIFGFSPFSPAPESAVAGVHFAGQVVEVVWWLTGARLLSMSLDKLLLPRAWREQRLFQDVFGALLFLGAVVAALGFVLVLPIRGLVATSGALAIVLGLAIQSTLSDVFAGIVLNTTEPYHVGDWVAVDDIEGKVVEMNWRATHLVNGMGNVVIVPNAVAAKAKITNNNRPPGVHGIALSLDISPTYRPKTVLEALERALVGCRGLLINPAAYARLKSTDVNAFKYEIVAYVPEMAQKTSMLNELSDLCFRHLQAAEVFLQPLGSARPLVALTTESIHSTQPGRVSDETTVALLRKVEMFRSVGVSELDQLAQRLERRDFPIGTTIVDPATVMENLTIVQSGVLSVSIDEDNKVREIARFGPGDTFGEAGLLAGTTAGVLVTAMTPVVLYQLPKQDLSPFLKLHPGVATQLCMLLSRRQDALGKLTEPVPVSDTTAHSAFHWLMEKVIGHH